MARLKKIKFADGGRTVILKPDERKERPFFAKWKKHIWKISIPALAVLAIAAYNIFVRAEILSYYPASCLGNWENVVNAVGQPKLASGASADQFTMENSAHYPGAEAQIFCGNFASGGDPLNKIFKQAAVHFVWSINSASASQISAPASSTSGAIAAPAAPPPDATAANVSSTVVPSGTSTASSSADVLPRAAPQAASSSSDATSSPSPLPPPAPPSSVSPPPATSSSDVALPPPPPAPAPAPAPPTTLLYYFAPVAFADASFPSSGSTPVADAASSSASSTSPSSTLLIPFNLAAPATSSAVITQGSDLLIVSYSLDGKNWTQIGSVNANNWQNISYNLPLHSWDELKQLQISIQGASQEVALTNNIYLDGMEVDVQYDSPNFLGSLFGAPSSGGGSASSSAPAASSAKPIVFDEMARERCEVQPFSLKIKSGGIASGSVILHPSNGSSTAALTLGDLPPGITAALSRDPADQNHYILSANASADAQKGSLSLNIIYAETEPDNSISNTFCQYNLVVTE